MFMVVSFYKFEDKLRTLFCVKKNRQINESKLNNIKRTATDVFKMFHKYNDHLTK